MFMGEAISYSVGNIFTVSYFHNIVCKRFFQNEALIY